AEPVLDAHGQSRRAAAHRLDALGDELATRIPGIGLGVRRLHDIGRSGWWTLIAFTVIGLIPLIYWACQPGERSENRFGPDVEQGR
ncbi:MAG: DUF805 domain-containing protein, partial [Pseudomonadota bacterium]